MAKAKTTAKEKAVKEPKAPKAPKAAVDAKKVRITQVRSTIKRPETQLRTIKSLGLGRRDRWVEVAFTPQIQGMVKKVSHLVSVKDI